MTVSRLFAKTLLILALALPGLDLVAQPNPVVDTRGHMGIGTAQPDPAAILDLNSTTAGLLLPRLNATQIANLVNPPTGLLVFNTSTGELNYNFGTPGTPNWQPLLSPAAPSIGSTVWMLTGNTVTPAHFLGSTNSAAVIFKSNNTERMRITAGGAVGIGTATPGEALDVTGNLRFSGALMPAGTAGTAGEVLISSGAGTAPVWTSAASFSFWSLSGNNLTGGAPNTPTEFFGSTNNYDVVVRSNGTERLRVASTGQVGINAAPSGDQLNVGGAVNTSTQYNIGGARALAVDGTNNLFAGVGAGISNTSGQSNTAVGSDALRDNTTGQNNTAVGSDALHDNTNGSNNTATGQDALRGNTSGDANTAVGSDALTSNTSGQSNTAVGADALNSNTSGNNNTAMGRNALRVNTGGNNTAIGRNALESTTSGQNNTALGRNAGGANTTGSNNTFVGEGANASAGSLSNATAIGAGATVGQSNALVLGNGADVGIGTSTPGQRLEVRNGNLMLSNSGTAGELRLQEPNASGTDYTALVAQAQANSITYTLPAANGTANQALMLTGAPTATAGTLIWGNPAAGSLVLPFSQTAANASQLFTLTNTDATTGGAGDFIINNAVNTGNALSASTNGTGSAMNALASGSGTAIIGQTTASGTGSAGSFVNFNAANANATLTASTNGIGHALSAIVTGSGRAGNFVINNAANTNIAVNGFTDGTGSAGNFQISNAASAATALTASTNGTGLAFSTTGGAQINDGNLMLSTSTATPGELRFGEPGPGSTEYTAFRAQTQAANVTYMLPATQGGANTVLTNDGAGTLSWATNGATIINTTNSSNTGGGSFGANQDDLALSSTATFFRMETSVAIGVDITGIAGGVDGRVLIVCNVGANPITLKHQDAGSSAANRFELPGASDVTLGQAGIVTLVYDATSGYWRMVSSN